MIVFEGKGDLLISDCQTLVCPVNTSYVMGCGLALAFKNRYDGLFQAYKKACHSNLFETRGLFCWEYLPDRKVLCLPTKRRWQNPSKLDWIDQALECVANDWQEYGITSLGIPMIGCGAGELKWENVRPLIYQHLEPIELEVSIYVQ